MMRGSTEFMACTLNDVLSMQKIEEGKLELDMQPFALPDAVGKVLTTFRGAAVAKAICFTQESASARDGRQISCGARGRQPAE